MLSATPGHYVLSVLHRVRDLEAAARFFVDELGFELRAEGNGFAQLENGALALRLLALGLGEVPGELELELVSSDLAESMAHLAQLPGVRALGEPVEVALGRFEQRWAAPHGLTLVVMRQLDADELGLELELPTHLPWQPEALTLVREVLRFVPLAFRSGAYRRTVETAEFLTLGAGTVDVTHATALRALLESTPAFQQERLRAELARLGLDLEPEAGQEHGGWA